MPREHRLDRRYLILAVGVVALSTAVILVKLSELPPGILATGRLLGGAAILTPLMLAERRKLRPPPFGWTDLKNSLPAAILLAFHFIVWFVGIRLTTAANATLVVNLTPVAMPFALFLLVGERVTAREVVGTLIATAGVLVLGLGGAAEFSLASFWGDLVCIAGMLLCVFYLVLARRNGRGRGIVGYLVPLYATAGVLTLAYSALSGEIAAVLDARHAWPRELALLVGLALIPTAFGHSVLNYSMVHLRGQVVAVANLGQVFFATLFAIPLLGERPELAFYPACALIFAGAIIAIFRPRVRPARAREIAGAEVEA